MRTRRVKANELIALVATLAAVLTVSVVVGFAAWSGGPGTTEQWPQAEPPPGFASKYAEVNGFRMHYVEGGKGSPVVLIHGFPQTWAEWRSQMGPLAEDHTVIAVDLRGIGDSEITGSGHQTARMADDVHQLLKQLKLNKGVQIVGHDVGLYVAYAYAAQWPSEVRRMAVLEGHIPDSSIYSLPALPASPKTPSVWHFGFFQTPLAEQLIAGHERPFIRDFIAQHLTVTSAFSPADYDFYAHYLKEPGRTKAWMDIWRQLRADVAQNEKFAAQGKLRMPILAIGGQASFGGSIADQWRQYAVNVDSRVIEGSGHWVTEEKPQEVTALLQSFLQR
ncbi:alpha/beta hydrolase [Actinacidiphila glaucinigra]|uniref:alpha/beta fold hydrolase n=1 Tax=Actinacidiphila glaucinigra TaxID=235986 RepID=UPI0033AC0D42